MKLWLSKNSEIPIKDQLVTQVLVGVAAGDLKVGEKLPSTRELARRFGIHPNTVSAAYRQLAKNGCVDKRTGSGVFVAGSNGSQGDALDGLIDVLLSNAETAGFDRAMVLQRLLARIQPPKGPNGFALFEPNKDLADIIVHEIMSSTGLPVERVEFADIEDRMDRGLLLIALADERAKLETQLPEGRDCILLTANSVAGSMTGHSRPSEEDIVAIASAWDDFHIFARLFLIAAKIDPDAIVSVSTKERGWISRLDAASFVICDSKVAEHLDGDPRLRTFPLVASASIDGLRDLAGS
ncbi:MAG: GntR family transcriptional regulator [Pyrinomonadaceae bacterium]